MAMKKTIIAIVVTIISVTNAFSQELQVQDLKTRLNYYKTLCDKISENIDCVKRDEKNLNQKAKNDQQVFILVKKITKEINGLSKDTENLSNYIKSLDELLQTTSNEDPKTVAEPVGNAPVPPPTLQPNLREERTPASDGETDVREPVEGGESGDTNQEAYINKKLEKFLAPLSFDNIFQKSERVKFELDKYGQNPLCKPYYAILQLVSIQHKIYNQNEIQAVLQLVSEIDRKKLYGNHASELEKELNNLKAYRYATMELQRLTKMISNTNEISSKINKKDDGAISRGNSKWEEPEEQSITPEMIKKYLRENKETEYVDKFAYTKEMLEKYIEDPSIRREFDIALKKALD